MRRHRSAQDRPPYGSSRRSRTCANAMVTGALSASILALGAIALTSQAAAAGSATTWTVYHGDAAGSGVSTSIKSVQTATRAWTSGKLVGQLYGEPLDFGGHVFVATEDDRVYALSSVNGRVVWSRRLAAPVPASALPCGDISPTVGITGTPVIDASRHEIFVVADEWVHGRPAHVLVGLDTTSGAVRMTRDVDPPGATPAALLQRTGLTLDAGRVVFGMGGNSGDCGPYRGRVVSVAETGGKPSVFTVDAAAGEREGAIWMGGAAPTVDKHGHIWVGVGNGSVTSARQAYDHSDAVLELSSSLHLLQYFAPSTWRQDNASDLDVSMAPALLADGQVVGSGKTRLAYLLNGARLGGIGRQQATLRTGCSADIDGGAAVVGTTVYLPCLSGPIALRVTASPTALHIRWRASAGGGPPIVAGNRVWTIGQNGVLYGLDPTTGAVRQRAVVGIPANHFPTPSVGSGLLLVPSANHVVAFRATATGLASQIRPETTSLSSGIGGPSGGIVGSLAAAAAALASAGWVASRRRRQAAQHRRARHNPSSP